MCVRACVRVCVCKRVFSYPVSQKVFRGGPMKGRHINPPSTSVSSLANMSSLYVLSATGCLLLLFILLLHFYRVLTVSCASSQQKMAF